jgi:hypothetical protein
VLADDDALKKRPAFSTSGRSCAALYLETNHFSPHAQAGLQYEVAVVDYLRSLRPAYLIRLEPDTRLLAA